MLARGFHSSVLPGNVPLPETSHRKDIKTASLGVILTESGETLKPETDMPLHTTDIQDVDRFETATILAALRLLQAALPFHRRSWRSRPPAATSSS